MSCRPCPIWCCRAAWSRELIRDDRIIGGRYDRSLRPSTRRLSTAFILQGKLLSHKRLQRAELVKLAENAFRDVKHRVCQRVVADLRPLGLNVWLVSTRQPSPPGRDIHPGTVFAGHCIPRRSWFIVVSRRNEPPILRASSRRQPKFVVAQILERAELFKRPVIDLSRLTYSPTVRRPRGVSAIDRHGTGARRRESDPDRRSD